VRRSAVRSGLSRHVWSHGDGEARTSSAIRYVLTGLEGAGGHLVWRSARAVPVSADHGWPRPVWGWSMCHLPGQRRVDGVLADEFLHCTCQSKRLMLLRKVSEES
jgi:hypothetical protein